MATFAKAPNSCELNRQINRGWAMQVKPVGTDPSEYRWVRGATNIAPNITTNSVDSTDLDSDGWEGQLKTSRNLTIQVDFNFARQGDTDLLDPAQTLLKYTGMELGGEGTIDARVWRTDTDEGWEGTFNNEFSTDGGDANGLRTGSASLQSVCAPTEIHSVEEGAEKKESKPVTKEERKQRINAGRANGRTASENTREDSEVAA